MTAVTHRRAGRYDTRGPGFRAWLRLVTSASRLRPDTRLGPWLFTVARNLYISYCRSRLLDMSFADMPQREQVEGWRRIFVFDDAPGAAGRPRLERGLLAWDDWEGPLACGLRFESIDEVQVWVGPTTGDFDLGIGIVDPAGAQRRQLRF